MLPPDKSLQRTVNHEVPGRGQEVSVPWRPLNSAVGVNVVTKSTQLTIAQACVAYDKGRLASAFRAFQVLADQGDDTAFLMLGYIHDTGHRLSRPW